MTGKMSVPETQTDPIQEAIDLVGGYMQAMNIRNSDAMDALRSPDFYLDFVYDDAFQNQPLSGAATRDFWPAWFQAFPDGEFEVSRTIVAESVVVVQWTFSGTQTGDLGDPVSNPPLRSTGRIACFRGVSIYDVEQGLISRETTYLDLATVMVELGVTP